MEELVYKYTDYCSIREIITRNSLDASFLQKVGYLSISLQVRDSSRLLWLSHNNRRGIYRCNLHTLNGIEMFPNLKVLKCSDNNLRSLHGLEGCPKVEVIYCTDNYLTSLEGLETCRNLREIYCGFNRISSLKGLEACSKLRSLYCNNNSE